MISLSVADMDFKIAHEIEDALIERVRYGNLGYGTRSEKLIKAISSWYKRRHDFDVNDEHIIFTLNGNQSMIMSYSNLLSPD
jgi:cystathionine beta-lyase